MLRLLTVLANIASRTLGQRGLNAFAASAGLVDVDAVTLTIGGLVTDGLPTAHAVEAIGLALICNQLSSSPPSPSAAAQRLRGGSEASFWPQRSAASITLILVAGAWTRRRQQASRRHPLAFPRKCLF
ncbi:MAG: DUF4010 domain-containing protein [Rhodoferax sp.]|nr:DUF4010 domain-containing protein [Rhodoferax sp.]